LWSLKFDFSGLCILAFVVSLGLWKTVHTTEKTLFLILLFY
jgi:hypothetical protein